MDGLYREFDAFDDADDAVSTQRTRTRDSLFLVAPMRLGTDQEAQDVRVRNLSEGGLMVETAKPLPVGTLVTLDVRGIGEVQGHVAWFAEGRAGIALVDQIDPKKARKPVPIPPKKIAPVPPRKR